MTLERYISEAVSHGRRHYTKPELGCTLEEILDWLELNGVQGTKYGVKKSIDVNKGEIGYLAGPWTNDKEEQWVCVGNYWGQRVTINPNISVPSKWYDDRNKMLNGWELSFDEAIKLIERMIANSYRKLEYKEVIVLNEAVSHGKSHSYKNRPDKDSGISDITSWLEDLGFQKMEILPGGKSSILKIPRYSLNKDSYRFTIEFKFIGKDKRWYWGQFTKGVYDLYTRLIDFTHPAAQDIMFDSGPMSSRNPADIINDVTEFVEDNVCIG